MLIIYCELLQLANAQNPDLPKKVNTTPPPATSFHDLSLYVFAIFIFCGLFSWYVFGAPRLARRCFFNFLDSDVSFILFQIAI